jgi:hypothetical protein
VTRTLVLLLLSSRLVFAWGFEGHQLVARIAEGILTPDTKAQIQAILGPGESISALASWADEVRPSRPESAPWHYIDIPVHGTGLDMHHDCPDGNCVIAKIEEFRNVWRDSAVTKANRREALLFLVHFVGDMHQPLHCSDNDDKGGNDVLVRIFGEDAKLHSVWDSRIIEHMPDEEQLFSELSAAISPELARNWSRGTVTDWAMEAFQIAKDTVYGLLPPTASGQRVELSPSYVREAEPVIKLQIERAGVRLAAILNQTAQ